MPKKGSVIARQNSTIIRNSNPQPKAKTNCNCERKPECPVPGECHQDGVIYQTTVTSSTGRMDPYVGLAKKIKKRYPKHKKSLAYEFAPGGTALTNYFWKEKNAGRATFIDWRKMFLYLTLSQISAGYV